MSKWLSARESDLKSDNDSAKEVADRNGLKDDKNIPKVRLKKKENVEGNENELRCSISRDSGRMNLIKMNYWM